MLWSGTSGLQRGIRCCNAWSWRAPMSQVLGLSPAPTGARAQTREWFDGWQSLVTVFAVAATLALVASLLGWRGSDLPAQTFRAELFKRDGFVLWNSQWFGGHALLAYSVL